MILLVHGVLPTLGLCGSYLTYSIDAGRLVITSVSAADDQPQIRVYDVTPLVKRNVAGQRLYDYARS